MVIENCPLRLALVPTVMSVRLYSGYVEFFFWNLMMLNVLLKLIESDCVFDYSSGLGVKIT